MNCHSALAKRIRSDLYVFHMNVIFKTSLFTFTLEEACRWGCDRPLRWRLVEWKTDSPASRKLLDYITEEAVLFAHYSSIKDRRIKSLVCTWETLTNWFSVHLTIVKGLPYCGHQELEYSQFSFNNSCYRDCDPRERRSGGDGTYDAWWWLMADRLVFLAWREERHSFRDNNSATRHLPDYHRLLIEWNGGFWEFHNLGLGTKEKWKKKYHSRGPTSVHHRILKPAVYW